MMGIASRKMKKKDGTYIRPMLLLAFLTFVNALNFADRFLSQAFSVDMITDLHLSNLQFTLLTGFAFTTFYTLLGLLMGALADRVHRPRLMSIGIFAWSALTTATGLTSNFLQIATVRMLTGVGEATLTPAALGLLGDTFNKKYRAFAAGFYYLGAPLGIGSAFIIAGALGTEIGWRNCFFVLGGVGIIPSGLFLLMREPRATTSSAHARPKHSLIATLRQIKKILASSPALILVIVSGVLVIFAQGTFVLDQLWLVNERGFTKQHAQNISGFMFLIGGIVGSILGGLGADLMQARYSDGRLRFLAIVYSIAVPIGVVYRLVDPSGYLFYPCMFVGSVMITIGYGPLFACLHELVPENMRSTMTAFMILCMTLFGTSSGNLMIGWLVDRFKSVAMAEPITLAVLIGLIPWLLAIPCLYLAAHMHGRDKTD